MTEKELKLFNEICYVALMNGATEGRPFEYEISPDYITEKSNARDKLACFWEQLHALIRFQVKQYCDRWDLPLDQWLKDLQIEEPLFDFEKKE